MTSKTLFEKVLLVSVNKLVSDQWGSFYIEFICSSYMGCAMIIIKKNEKNIDQKLLPWM